MRRCKCGGGVDAEVREGRRKLKRRQRERGRERETHRDGDRMTEAKNSGNETQAVSPCALSPSPPHLVVGAAGMGIGWLGDAESHACESPVDESFVVVGRNHRLSGPKDVRDSAAGTSATGVLTVTTRRRKQSSRLPVHTRMHTDIDTNIDTDIDKNTHTKRRLLRI